MRRREMSSKVNLKEAVNRIWETIQITKENEGSNCYPYFFIVGAGISMPEIPSARGIIEACQNKVKEMYGSEEEIQAIVDAGNKYAENSSKYYSYWFGTAYKNKIHRQQYLKKIINSSKISTSNLLLAQLMNSKKIATTVITPNFDNHLLKSLNLLGNYEVFSTNSIMDNMALVPNASEIQIMHVHGTYQFYDCKNLDSEILEVAMQQGMKSVAGTIEDFLKNQVPIVIGYSGWEDDVLMTKLRERLVCADLPYNLIWFCYSEKDYESLPQWLKESNDVVFVCVSDTDAENNDREEYVLPAEDVLSALISRFEIDAPYIFTNPIKYYLDIIDGFLPQNIEAFPIEFWKKRLDYFEEQLTEIEKQLMELGEAAARRDIKEVTRIISSININYISADEVLHIMNVAVYPFANSKNRIDENGAMADFLVPVVNLLKEKGKEFSEDKLCKYLYMLSRCVLNNYKSINSDVRNDIFKTLLQMSEETTDHYLKLAILKMKSDTIGTDEKIHLIKDLIKLGENEIEDIRIARLIMYSIGELIESSHEVEIYYLDLMKKIIDIHSSDDETKESFYYNRLSLCESEQIDINVNEVIDQIQKDSCSPGLLLHARKLQCDLENDIERKMIIAEQSVSEYDIENINSCMECKDYAWILHYLIKGKGNCSKGIEQKYVDEAFALCYKEHKCKFICLIIVSAIGSYVESIESFFEKKALLERTIKLLDDVGIAEDYCIYLQKLFSYMDLDEKNRYISENKKSGIVFSAKQKISEAVELYIANDKDKCRDFLLDASEQYESIFEDKYNPALINICFMVRRGEIPEIQVAVLELLKKITWMDNDATYCINEALAYVQQSDWEKANESICKIGYYLEDAIQWWSNEDVVGKSEKNMVLSLLLFNDKILKTHEALDEGFWNGGYTELALPEYIIKKLDEALIEEVSSLQK